jgi:hypothetical protein
LGKNNPETRIIIETRISEVNNALEKTQQQLLEFTASWPASGYSIEKHSDFSPCPLCPPWLKLLPFRVNPDSNVHLVHPLGWEKNQFPDS